MVYKNIIHLMKSFFYYCNSGKENIILIWNVSKMRQHEMWKFKMDLIILHCCFCLFRDWNKFVITLSSVTSKYFN